MKNHINLKDLHIYFIGIGGISMSGLAKLVLSKGAIVSGSDIADNAETRELSALGCKIYIGHHPNRITEQIDLVVYTLAVDMFDPELHRANELGIKTMSRAEFLGLIASTYQKVISVAGTHGKTTTTSLIAEIMRAAGLNPTIHIGGKSLGLKGNTIVGGDEFFLVEACEYKDSFLNLKSHIGVITNIEFDHPDYYKDLTALKTSFKKFANNSLKVICLNDCDILHQSIVRINEDWCAKHVEFIGGGYNFNVFYKDKFYGTFRINLLGYHNVINSLFAIAVAHELGIDVESIERGLSGFLGVERRYETIYKFSSQCRVIIDYAHHPTEIKSSVDGIKEIYKKSLYIFQPHTYSRTKQLFEEFLGVINDLENIVLFKTYPARECEIAGGTAMDLYLKAKCKNKEYFDCENKLMDYIEKKHKDFDCVLVLGAGNLAEKLKRNYLKRL